MAKKKTTAKKAKLVVKPVAKKAAAKAVKSARPASEKPAQPTKPAKTKTSSPQSGAAKTAGYISLGRPKVTADEPLYLLFKDDYHARQLFEFLRVQTVHDLEQFAAEDIVARLSRPIHESVERIRQKLADKNRYLAGDEQYLAKHRKNALAIAEKE